MSGDDATVMEVGGGGTWMTLRDVACGYIIIVIGNVGSDVGSVYRVCC